ncbi:hypothetical protein [Cellulophaga baltica]|uniref:Uncharacterized protein n=1 Tax=Cellulophaga baltica TaxID=76594 RepID=A0A1G7FB27_9FLAO|nr:hypothetical protein [Cellulophaga baltica]SDE73072.1 hypothetical protein SAMN04487992_103149 [Cellulophaga baltica]
MEKIKKILEGKSKNELLVIAKKSGTKRYSSLSKEKLINKLLNDKQNHANLNNQIGLKSRSLFTNTWFQGLIFLILSFLVACYFFQNSASKEDLNNVIEIVDKNELYIREIEFLGKYKKKFLESEMNFQYKLFGEKGGNITTIDELKSPNAKSNYTSNIQLNFDENVINVDISINELNFDARTTLDNSVLKQKFPLIEDKFYIFRTFKFNGNVMKFVLLKADREQPVYAIGIGAE